MSRPSIDEIYRAVSVATGVGRVFIRGRSRRPVIVHARAVAADLMRRRGMSHSEIARELSKAQSSITELLHGRRNAVDHLRDVEKASETLHAQVEAARP